MMGKLNNPSFGLVMNPMSTERCFLFKQKILKTCDYISKSQVFFVVEGKYQYLKKGE